MRSPARVITAWPARTCVTPSSCSTSIEPSSTTVNSSKSGAWKGSSQPLGATMCAMETASSPLDA